MSKARETFFRDVCSKIEGEYGRTVTPIASMPPIDAVVFLIIATRHTKEVAERSHKALVTDFVDWNEVRVSSPREIAISLKIKERAAREERAQEIRDFLVSLFRERSQVSLAFLTELDYEAAAEMVGGLEGVNAGLAAQIALFLSPEEGIQSSTHLVRVARRLGLVDKRATPTKTRAALEKMVGDNGDRHRLHRVLMHIGMTVCLPKTLKCAECLTHGSCPSSKAPAKSAAKKAKSAKPKAAAKAKAPAKAAKPAAAKKSKAKPAAKAGAKKAGAPKKAAAKKAAKKSPAKKTAKKPSPARKTAAKKTTKKAKAAKPKKAAGKKSTSGGRRKTAKK